MPVSVIGGCILLTRNGYRHSCRDHRNQSSFAVRRTDGIVFGGEAYFVWVVNHISSDVA